jgi:hypothetical protein
MSDKSIVGLPLGPRVISAEPKDGYRLLLRFSNGENRLFDASPLLDCPAFRPLKSVGLFNSVRVECGTVVWPNGIDYCPDTLYAESVPPATVGGQPERQSGTRVPLPAGR